jgi:hypothetical protein
MFAHFMTLVLCVGLFAFAPWQLNAVFYVWLATTSARNRRGKNTPAKTATEMDLDIAELNSFREMARQKASRRIN